MTTSFGLRILVVAVALTAAGAAAAQSASPVRTTETPTGAQPAAAARSVADTADEPARDEVLLQVLPGASRVISHASSASRDTAVMGWALTPYSVLTAGADVGVLGLRLRRVSLRLGFFGLIELESDRTFDGGPGDFIPRQNSAFWRAHGGYSLAVSLDQLARELLGPRGAFEAAFSLRHESEHFTGNPSGDSPMFGDRPHIGNFFLGDVGTRIPFGSLDLELRVQEKVFVGERNYSHGPGADLVFRWRFLGWLHLFSSTFAEILFGVERRWEDGREVQVPNNYMVRNLTGLSFPGALGEIMIFSAVEIGHGKGLNVYREAVRWGGGLRLAFF